MQDFSKKNFPFLVLTLAVFLLLLLPELVQDGMFLDGVTYAAVSKNLAQGLGSFWYPHYSKTLYPAFHEHPPLVFGLQSIFFRLFGDGIYTERIYTFFTALVTGFLIIKFWRFIFRDDVQLRQLQWLPVLLWITIPLVSWSYKNNMLENTMGVFTLAAVYFIYKGLSRKHGFFWLFFAAFFILAALLSKGLVALFPLGTAFIFMLIKKEISFGKMLAASLSVTGFLLLFLGFIIVFIPDASDSLWKYFDIQVLRSLKGEREVPDENRFFIIERLFFELLPVILFAVIIVIIVYRKSLHHHIFKNKFINRESVFFLLVAFSASLPIVISPKQMGYYLVPSFPFFALAFAVFISPYIKTFIGRLNPGKKSFLFFQISVFALLAVSLFFTAAGIGATSRDNNLLEDVYKIGEAVPQGEIITVPDDMCAGWGAIAYFSRYLYVSLDCGHKKNRFQLVRKNGTPKFEGAYVTLPLELNNFILLEEIRLQENIGQ